MTTWTRGSCSPKSSANAAPTSCNAPRRPRRLVALETTPVDLIVADLGMPDVDGYEMIRRVRRMHERHAVPSIAVSAYSAPRIATPPMRPVTTATVRSRWRHASSSRWSPSCSRGRSGSL
jgi:CheY-like chemotaxis protein